MLPRGTQRDRGDQGVTLVEVLVSIVILGIAGVAILAGIQMSIVASDLHRKQSTGGAYARSYAEAIQDYLTADPANWVPCAPANTYDFSDLPVADRPAEWPGGYTGLHIASTPLVAYDGDSGSTCTTDTAILIRIEVDSPDARDRVTEVLDFVIRRPCEGTSCTP